MGTYVRQFNSSLQASGQPGATVPQSAGAGNTPGQASNKPAQKDNSGFRMGETVLIKDEEGNDIHFEEPDVEYYFEIEVFNTGKLPTDPFKVRFEISDLNWHDEFPMDAGLDAGHKVTAAVYYGKFPLDTDVTLSACVYLNSAPDTPKVCTGTANILVKKWH
jgi:hypothetical protein